MNKLRCAIYTRKSSEEGLDQDFNSLHAQRESCEAYVQSQKSEGWMALAAAYDDGGFSGGTMERPGVKRLMADIATGRIDIVVVYKVDRLTRSLADFAKMVEVFDRHGVSFVSVTQAFNTTSSMGRLTLNVLLSFAQFEREVTGERIRDKIAASKAKGMWMGGTVPLGYAAKDRTLIVLEDEAAIVRRIFARYLDLGSVHKLRDQLEAEGVRSKSGAIIARGALFHLLRNRVYVGQIVHKDLIHPGRHPGIVDPALFGRVQAILDEHARERAKPSKAADVSLLIGLIFDEAGTPMTPTFALGRGGKRYRYYVSTTLLQGGVADPGSMCRIPAADIETVVGERVGRASGQGPCRDRIRLKELIQRIDVRADSLRLELDAKALDVKTVHDLPAIRERLGFDDDVALDGNMLRLIIPVRIKYRGGRTWITASASDPAAIGRRHDEALQRGLRKGHAVITDMGAAPWSRDTDWRQARGHTGPYEQRIFRLALLAPDIQRVIVEGRQPAGLTIHQLTDAELPVSWVEQRARFGFAAVAEGTRALTGANSSRRRCRSGIVTREAGRKCRNEEGAYVQRTFFHLAVLVVSLLIGMPATSGVVTSQFEYSSRFVEDGEFGIATVDFSITFDPAKSYNNAQNGLSVQWSTLDSNVGDIGYSYSPSTKQLVLGSLGTTTSPRSFQLCVSAPATMAAQSCGLTATGNGGDPILTTSESLSAQVLNLSAAGMLVDNAVQVKTIGPDIYAYFSPNGGVNLSDAASILGVDSFNWQQVVTGADGVVPVRFNSDPSQAPVPPFNDPPSGGYTYETDIPTYPYYLTNADLKKAIINDGETIYFHDLPSDPCLGSGYSETPECNGQEAGPGGAVYFSTYLVGVTSYGPPEKLFEFDWKTTYDGTSGEIARLNDLGADPNSGSGGVTLLREENLLPAAVPEPPTWLCILFSTFLIGLRIRSTRSVIV